MEQDFKKVTTLPYPGRFGALAQMSLDKDDFDMAVFLFGLLIGTASNKHHEFGMAFPDTPQPWLQNFTAKWSVEELRKTQNGTSKVNECADVPDGALFQVQQIRNCVSEKFSSLACLYLVGEALGRVNSALIRSDEFVYAMNQFHGDFFEEKGAFIVEALTLLYLGSHKVVLNEKKMKFELSF